MSNDFQVFFTHIPSGTTLEEIKSLFSTIGIVKSAKFGRDEKFGFVSYFSQKDAEKAVAALNKKEPLNLRVDWPRKSDGTGGGGGSSSSYNNNTSRSASYRDDHCEDSFSTPDPIWGKKEPQQQQQKPQNNSFFGSSMNSHLQGLLTPGDFVDTTASKTAATANENIDEFKITEILNYLVRVRDAAFIENQNRMARDYVRKNFAALQAVNESFNLISSNLETLAIGSGSAAPSASRLISNGSVTGMATTTNGFKEPKWHGSSSFTAGAKAAGSVNGGSSFSKDTSAKREYWSGSHDNTNRNQLQRSSSNSSFNGKRSKPYPSAVTHDECDSWDNDGAKKKEPVVVAETAAAAAAAINNGSEWEDDGATSSSLKPTGTTTTTTATSQFKSISDDIMKTFNEFTMKKSSETKEEGEPIETSPSQPAIVKKPVSATSTDLETTVIPPPPLIEVCVVEKVPVAAADDVVIKTDVSAAPKTSKAVVGGIVGQRKLPKTEEEFVRVKATAVESQQIGHIVVAECIPEIERMESELLEVKPTKNFDPKIGKICIYCESKTMKRYRVQITKVDEIITAKMIDNGRIIKAESSASFIDLDIPEFLERPFEAIKIEIRNSFKMTENLIFDAKYCFENPELNLVVIDARYLEEEKPQVKSKIRSFVTEDSIVSKGYIELYKRFTKTEIIASCVVEELQDKLTEIEEDALQSNEIDFKPEVGDFCYGLRPNDQEWLRCKVLKLKPEGSFLMALLDYGLTETCLRVRPISSSILAIPHFSVLIESENVTEYENKTYYFHVLSKQSNSFHVEFSDEAGNNTLETFIMKPFYPDLAYNNLQ